MSGIYPRTGFYIDGTLVRRHQGITVTSVLTKPTGPLVSITIFKTLQLLSMIASLPNELVVLPLVHQLKSRKRSSSLEPRLRRMIIIIDVLVSGSGVSVIDNSSLLNDVFLWIFVQIAVAICCFSVSV